MEENIAHYQPTELQNQPEKHWLKIAGLSVLGLVLAGSLVWAGVQIGRRQTQSTPPPAIPTPPPATPTLRAAITPTLPPELTTFLDETAGWKIYTNTKYGYSIKYPKDWFVLVPTGGQAGGECLEATFNETIVEFSKQRLQYCGFVGEQLPAPEVDFTIWVNDQQWEKLNLLGDSDYEHITIDGEKAGKYKFTERSELPNIQATRIYLNRKGKGYLIFLKQTDKKGSYDPIYDLILSTFRFLD